MDTFISRSAQIDTSTYVGAGVRVYGPVMVGPACVLEDYCILGKPDMNDLQEIAGKATTLAEYDAAVSRPTVIGPGCILGAGTQIYCGSRLGENVSTEDLVRIGWDSEIGSRTRIMYRAQVYCGAKVGEECRIAGYVGDNTRIADRVAFFGSTIHDYPYRTTTYEWRPFPTIGADSIVAFGAQIIGGVKVGERAYVGANAVVTRDVGDDVVVVSHNKQFPRSEWPGKLGNFEPRNVTAD